jgi:hypothetical protein
MNAEYQDCRPTVKDACGGRTLVRVGLQSRYGSEAKASRGLEPALQGPQQVFLERFVAGMHTC